MISPEEAAGGAPVSRAIALADPREALAALADLPHAFLLHSALAEPRGRWSFFGADPFETFAAADYERATELWRGQRRSHANPGGGAPFTGGLVGYWAYDFGRRLERLPVVARDDLALPDVWLAAYDVIGAFDHARGECRLHSSGLPATGAAAERRAGERLEAFARLLEGAGATHVAHRTRRDTMPRVARSTFSPEGYRAGVARVIEHIRRGDLFQANLSQRWTIDLEPAELAAGPAAFARRAFLELARQSPAPFGAWLDCGDHAVASASPERFLELRGARVETRPIKGTRPRGATPEEDSRQRGALAASSKDRAENVMIVDVLRNDLGRVCETGSIAVPELCVLEEFAQVFHLTSTVTGTLAPGRDALDLLHACFPGGSITGAPKIRAMEILEQLEPVRRHLYTGAIGWLDWNGDADWNIAIRTATVTRSAVHFSAGGGITSESDPDAEYRETLDKAEGMRRALGTQLGEIALAPEPVAPAPQESQS